ncbi:UNVERIFIED_CONTAM: Acp2 [Trichonephila clavipes]
MQHKIKHPEDKLKVYVYSGHGSNIAAVLQALRVFNQRIPTYGSSILFELYREDGGNHSVRILLSNATEPEKYIPPPHVLYMPGCDEFCPLEVVERSTADLFPLEWEKECMEANEKRIWKILNPPPDRPLGYYY